MAILNSIRKRGIFLIIIIAMALFAFVASGLFKSTGGAGSTDETLATINGDDISRLDFAKKVEAAQQGGASTLQVMKNVWNQEVRRVLLEQQFEKLGLKIDQAQISQAIKEALANNPNFQNELGEFDEIKLQEYVANLKATSPQAYQQWLDFENNIATSVLEKEYFNLVKGGLITTLKEGEFEYHFQNDKIDIQYVQVPYSKIPDEEVPVSDKEIAQYIKAHPKQFEVAPQVDIQYVQFVEEPSPQDIDDAREDMLQLLKERVAYNTATKTNDTVLSFEKTTDIETFVNKYSERPYVDRWWFKNNLSDQIKDTIFKMKVGQVYGPYKVNNTYNLTKLVAKGKLPDSVKARHILIPFIGSGSADATTTQNEEQAKKRADSLLTVLKRNKSKFGEFVKTYSSDKGSIENEGVYDYFPYQAMVAPFRDFAFENKTGDMGVVKTRFGYHIMEILGQKNFQDVVKIATISKTIEPSEKTLNDIFSKSANFEVDSQKGDFNEVAKEKGFDVKPVNKIGELDATLPGIGENRSIVNWAFNEDTKIGDVKRFNLPNGYVIVQLTRRNPKALKSVAEASAVVTPILRKEKKAKKLRESITGTTLQEISASQGVVIKTANAITRANPNIPGIGPEPKVIGEAFGTKEGETTDLIDGNTGIFKVKVLKITIAPALENYAGFAGQLNNTIVPRINNDVINALKKTADIEDNRAKFY
jgi:parvulin-like peptidyl-prolyl isomerase